MSQESKNTAENRSETSEKTAKNRDKTSKKSQKKLRFELDHSAKFYPIMSTKKAQSLFRISAIMTEEVDKDKLQIALNDVLPRFEAYRVRLKKGYAWHFFEYNDAPCKVFAEETLLKPINPADTNGYWFRVSALGNKIVLEIFHALADGNGALAFLKSIVKRYREVLGVNVEDEGVIDWQSQPHQEEIEDSFEKNYKPISLGQMNLKALAGKVPHRIKGTLSKDGYAVSEGVAEAQDVLKKAKEIGVSFTAYIAGVLAYSIEKTCKNKLPIAVMIPVNLRALYPSKTMRNFVTFVRIILAPNECKSIEECAKETQRQLKILGKGQARCVYFDDGQSAKELDFESRSVVFEDCDIAHGKSVYALSPNHNIQQSRQRDFPAMHGRRKICSQHERVQKQHAKSRRNHHKR